VLDRARVWRLRKIGAVIAFHSPQKKLRNRIGPIACPLIVDECGGRHINCEANMKSRDISPILRHFNELPDCAIVPQKVSCLILGVSGRSFRRKKPMPLYAINGLMRGNKVGDLRRELAKREDTLQ
jgi:hypothetical protein